MNTEKKKERAKQRFKHQKHSSQFVFEKIKKKERKKK
jgi:hypothetical protein